ncbi:hypothetical protein GJ744_009955 [Endocarpon pusillum]|uniref:NACHT domain-containing protein n=1 Tax=Endocarpon pusillum TaxID=364733 RepID=A0A8H7AIZ9_9EURO|nr:hypothetical protein GJ744_009955 [Endocarpon pusillum]
MSRALANASRLKPDIRLAQAVSQFEADLSSEQKNSFHTYRSQSLNSPPDPSDVMRLTAEIDCRVSGKVGGRCFGPRLTNFLQGVQQFAALGDILVGGSQNLIACGVWSLVRMSLLLSVNFFSYLEKLSTLLMTVGRSAPRYQEMALLYSRSKNLQSHLSEYFIVVVHLCHQLLKFTQKSTLGQITSTLSDSDMKTYQSELDLWAGTIKEEVDLLMARKIEEEAEKNSRFRALSSKVSKSVSLQQKIETKLFVLNSCSMYDYEATWKQTRKVGNATLFNQTAEYQDWKGRTDSCTLMYTGKLGSGKSVSLANIVDDLNLHVRKKDIVVAYFFCRHDVSESLKARTVIGSLARQLLLSVPDLTKVVGLLGEASPALDFEGLFRLLQRALPPKCKAYFILDGLDECNDVERNIMISQLRKLQEIFALLLCVSLRLEPNNASKMCSEQLTAARITSIPDDNPDIAAFIGAELESCIESEKLVIGNPALILEIQDALLKGSQGMFLWVVLQIESLCAMKTDGAIRQALADLPRDLSETFSRILRKSEGLGKPYQRLILELVTVAHRPLTTEELREALSVVPGDAVWHPARLLNDIYLTLACCGSLVTIDEEELTIRLVHHSVKQFLLDGFKDSTNIAFTIDSAGRKMVDIIVTYLNYGVFETQLSTVVVPQIMTGSAPSRIICSTLDSSKSVRSLALKLLKFSKRPDYDIGKTLAEARTLRSPRSVDDFHFYAYAKLYWIQHICSISELELVMYDLLLRLFRGNAVNTNVTDEDGQTLLLWAANKGYEEVVKVLLDSPRVDPDSQDNMGRTPLWWAITNGHKAVVKVLLNSTRVNANQQDSMERTPLWWAIDKGYEEVVKVLLDSPRVDPDVQDNMERTPLWWAIMNGHKAVVKVLLNSTRVNANQQDSMERTPLWWAINKGHEEVVKVLLDSPRVDPDVQDNMERTPLWWAVEQEHESIIKVLLDSDRVDADAKDANGQTPLSWAAENGHEAVIRALLDSHRVDANTKDSAGRTPLLWAARYGHEVIIRVLLDSHRVDANAKDTAGRTPLSWAAENGHKAVIRALLDSYRVDADAKDSAGRTPLLWAARYGHKVIIRVLLDSHRVDANAKDAAGRTPLSWAAENGHEAIIRALLDSYRVDADAKDPTGRTPLSWAAENGHEAVIRALLDSHRVDVDAKDLTGRTPLSWAAEKGHEAVIRALLDSHRVDVDAIDATGRTPLSWAAKNGHEAIIRALLDSHRVDANAKDAIGRTPLSWAAENGHEAVIRVLLDSHRVDVDAKDPTGRTPLSWAAENGHNAFIRALLDTHRVDVDLADNYGRTPLMWAAEKGHHTVVEILEKWIDAATPVYPFVLHGKPA